MVYLLPKMPKGTEWIGTEFEGEPVYLTQLRTGPVIHFVKTNEIAHITWDEVIAMVAAAPKVAMPEAPVEKSEPDKAPQKGGPRQVNPTKPTH